MSNRIGVLMVCMGNICRSPMAQGVFEHLVAEAGLAPMFEIDSAGTHAYHVGEPPDRRAQETALRRQIDLRSQRARQVEVTDFSRFDYVLAMDRQNLTALQRLCPPEHQHKLSLYLDYAPHIGEEEVPDPYYGGPSGFERVYDMVEAAGRGLLDHIGQRHFQR